MDMQLFLKLLIGHLLRTKPNATNAWCVEEGGLSSLSPRLDLSIDNLLRPSIRFMLRLAYRS
eukprot:4897729-Amphidinium_carterae.1